MTGLFIIKKFFGFIKNRYAPRGAKISFSASGEDLIVSDLLLSRGIKKPSYVDIGAHHPVFGNNTYLFYLRGGKGVAAEPNSALCKIIKKKRKNDLCLCKGVGGKDSSGTFYSFPQDTRNTFSEEEAGEWEKTSGQKPAKNSIEILSLNSIISKYFSNTAPDFISIDAEGYDVEIISGFNWKVRPKIFCVESVNKINFNAKPERNVELYKLLRDNGYEAFAETPANTIFVDVMDKLCIELRNSSKVCLF